jgi:hypothetical protein
MHHRLSGAGPYFAVSVAIAASSGDRQAISEDFSIGENLEEINSL